MDVSNSSDYGDLIGINIREIISNRQGRRYIYTALIRERENGFMETQIVDITCSLTFNELQTLQHLTVTHSRRNNVEKKILNTQRSLCKFFTALGKHFFIKFISLIVKKNANQNYIVMKKTGMWLNETNIMQQSTKANNIERKIFFLLRNLQYKKARGFYSGDNFFIHC